MNPPPTSTSSRHAKLVGRILWVAIWCTLVGCMVWMGSSALEAWGRFPAPAWLLVSSLGLGAAAVLPTLWMVRRQSVTFWRLLALQGGILMVILGPRIVVDWLWLVDKFSLETQRGMVVQVQFLMFAGWFLCGGIAAVKMRQNGGTPESFLRHDGDKPSAAPTNY